MRGELRELRVRFANTYFRLLYQRSDNLQILLHVFEKDTRQLPEAEIEIAERRLADFKAGWTPRAERRRALLVKTRRLRAYGDVDRLIDFDKLTADGCRRNACRQPGRRPR